MIEKVDDTIIKIVFDRSSPYYFQMHRGDSYIFKKDDYKKVREYNSPFDVVLTKNFTNARIKDVHVLEGNRILRFIVLSSTKYKSKDLILQFEFTGRNTNVIILDKDEIVLEAFRHIDIKNSFREVKVGVKLLPLPERELNERYESIGDIDKFLHDEYKKRERKNLILIKNQKILLIDKKLSKLQKLLSSLEKEDELNQKSMECELKGNLILSNIHNIKNYQKEVEVIDFEGNKRVIILPSDTKTASEAANRFFTRAKKLKHKLKNSHIERENLLSKIDFLKKIKELIKSAKSIDEINLYQPKQSKRLKRGIKPDINIETFFINGYKIRLGKNKKGNIKLLKDSKMSDIWMHVKDIPSTHVIITNKKKTLPISVLEFGAKLCVQFSSLKSGSYLVDYTFRRDVKPKDGANVNYFNYKTIKVLKE